MSLLQIQTPAVQSTVSVNTSKTLSANNTTANVPIFRVTGAIRITKLYLVVTTALGTNHTGAGFRFNDQTSQIDITELVTGGTLSSFLVGGFAFRYNQAGSALVVRNSDVASVTDSIAAQTTTFSDCVLVGKNGVNNDIEYRYSTTDAPTSGAIQFFCEYQPLSASATVTAL